MIFDEAISWRNDGEATDDLSEPSSLRQKMPYHIEGPDQYGLTGALYCQATPAPPVTPYTSPLM
jgi:hypothetical protein